MWPARIPNQGVLIDTPSPQEAEEEARHRDALEPGHGRLRHTGFLTDIKSRAECVEECAE